MNELQEQVFALEKKVADLENIIAKWRYLGLKGLDTGSSLGDILKSTGDLSVDGTLTIGEGGAIKWGDDAEHEIAGSAITLQNTAESDSSGRVVFRSATDATRRGIVDVRRDSNGVPGRQFTRGAGCRQSRPGSGVGDQVRDSRFDWSGRVNDGVGRPRRRGRRCVPARAAIAATLAIGAVF